MRQLTASPTTVINQSNPQIRNLSGNSSADNLVSLLSTPFASFFTNSNLLTSRNEPSALSNIQTAGLMEAACADNANGTPTGRQNQVLVGAVSHSSGGTRKAGSTSGARKQELNNGAMLVAPEEQTKISTRFGTVQVAAKSMVLVVSNECGLSVYNLDDQGRGSVKVSLDDEIISLAPGRHATIASINVAEFSQINPATFVGYRNLSKRNLKNELQVFQAEFNQLSLVAGLDPLKNMFKSGEPAKKKKC